MANKHRELLMKHAERNARIMELYAEAKLDHPYQFDTVHVDGKEVVRLVDYVSDWFAYNFHTKAAKEQ